MADRAVRAMIPWLARRAANPISIWREARVTGNAVRHPEIWRHRPELALFGGVEFDARDKAPALGELADALARARAVAPRATILAELECGRPTDGDIAARRGVVDVGAAVGGVGEVEELRLRTALPLIEIGIVITYAGQIIMSM